MACKKQWVRMEEDETKVYSCKQCKELLTCKKDEARTQRAMSSALNDLHRNLSLRERR